MAFRVRSLRWVWVLLLAAGGCGQKVEALQPGIKFRPEGMVTVFSTEDWKIVLAHVVTPGGYVRWELLHKTAEREALFRFVSLIGLASPDNRPDLFPSKADREAYWINAYNAVCMYGVLRREEADPTPAFYEKDFFRFGGKTLTLDTVEVKRIEPLADPRVVFAVNRCTHSSPPLRNEPYDSFDLNAQLTEQGRVYLNDSRGVIRAGSAVKVNSLLAVKYAPLFLAAYQTKFNKPGTLLQAIESHAARHSMLAGATNLIPMGYDSALNRP